MLITQFYRGLSNLHGRLGYRALGADRRGVTAIEYALIALIIAIAVFGGALSIGGQLTYSFNAVSSEL